MTPSKDYPPVRKVSTKKDKSIFAETRGIEGQFLAIVECKCEITLIGVNCDDFALDQPMEQRRRITKHVPKLIPQSLLVPVLKIA